MPLSYELTLASYVSVLLDSRPMLCLNHGEPNPKTNHPDSACGCYYTAKEKDDDACKYHSGYLKNGVISGCFSKSATVSGSNNIGGIAGSLDNTDTVVKKMKIFF